MKVRKINKYSLANIATTPLIIEDTANTTAMTISHYLDAMQYYSDVIQFTIVPVETPVPFVKTPEFELTIRSRVDLSTNSPTQEYVTSKGSDIGKENYHNSSPVISRPLPPGFTELKGE